MLTVIYDGQCALCLQSKRIIQRLDWLKRLEWLDAHQNRDGALEQRFPGLNPDALLGEIHLLYADKTLTGFYAFRRMMLHLPLTFLFALLCYLPFVDRLGVPAYRWVARHRLQFNQWIGQPDCEKGICSIPD